MSNDHKISFNSYMAKIKKLGMAKKRKQLEVSKIDNKLKKIFDECEKMLKNES